MNCDAIRHMRWNLAKASAWVFGGLIAILLVEQAWDAGCFKTRDAFGEGQPEIAAGRLAGGERCLAAFAFEGDTEALGFSCEVPEEFIEECFSPAMVGDVLYAEPGPVVGITSTLPSGELFSLCVESLQSHGWLRTDGGEGLRASFVKESGQYRWAYLDVAQISDAGTAVIVLEEAA